MKKTVKICLLTSVALLLVGNSLAHQGATGVVKQRMDAMSEMGDAMKVMADMVKGKREFDPDLVVENTAILDKHAGELAGLFPDTDASRNGKMTEALPVIWDEWQRFEELSGKLQKSVDALREAAKNDIGKRDFRILFTKTAKSCSACHDDYRRPKE